MKNELKGFSKIFSFTFKQHVRSSGYKYATIIITLLCLILPAIIMPMEDKNDKDEKAYDTCAAQKVYVVDNSSTPAVDLNSMNQLGAKGFTQIEYISCGSDFERAKKECLDSGDYSLMLAIDETDGTYNVSVITPDKTKLTSDDSEAFKRFIENNFQYVLVQKSGLDYAQVAELTKPVISEVAENGEILDEQSGYDMAKKVISMVLPFVNIMLLYFMILIYGQGVANNVIMEKTSKLMDMFLITVKPAAMVMGKVLAIVLSGIMQMTLWIAGLVGGFTAGTLIVKAIDPQTDMGLVQLFDSLHIFSGMFSLPSIIVAIFIVLAGFLLYCSLASIGGAMASKPEDLSSTNLLFTLSLVVSFFCTMYAGGVNGMSSSAEWLNWFPLTAILVTPARLMVGQASLLTGIGSLVIVLICSVLVVILSGRIYKMMSLYKGKPPKISEAFKMLASAKK
jgi:ABC-type Na+ efflux pump permease subunit